MTLASPVRTRCPDALITAIRGAVDRRADWARTAALVAGELGRQLPDPAEILTAAERDGSAGKYACHVLHTEPDGAFSVVALVWRPGQVTPVHDHVAWCVFGILQGTEYEELYRLGPDGEYLEMVGSSAARAGEVGGFAPPGDIHRVRNSGAGVAISLHVYGADIDRLGSSVRRIYDLPVAGARPGTAG